MSAGGRRLWAIVVPLALPGEKIRVRTYRPGRLHPYSDLLEVITPNAELRDDSRAQCKYFGSCAGCANTRWVSVMCAEGLTFTFSD